LVVRRPSPTDARATMVELSDQGRSLLPKLKAAWRHVADQTVAGLKTTTVDHVIEVLTDLATGLNSTVAPTNDVPRYRAAHPRTR